MRVAICAVALLLASNAAAHHSLSLFETSAPVKFEGKVTRVDWRSPHTLIFVAEAGTGAEWRVETVPNSWLINRAGWTIDSVKAGEQVTVELYAYSDKTIKYGFLRRVIKADGKVWASPLDIGRRGEREAAERAQ
jgi:dipeptidyl aminopeptidase/acylaminoacyl peptidase